MKLGTVLPTREGLARADRHADRLSRSFQPVRDNLAVLAVRITTDGFESKYWLDATHYAIVSPMTGKVTRFERRADGDYAI